VSEAAESGGVGFWGLSKSGLISRTNKRSKGSRTEINTKKSMRILSKSQQRKSKKEVS
jgi:hypothetical protein